MSFAEGVTTMSADDAGKAEERGMIAAAVSAAIVFPIFIIFTFRSLSLTADE
jgi:hypothetical protein